MPDATPATLGAWMHSLSPFLVRFGDGIGLRWYGIAYACGFLVAWWWLRFMSRRGMTPLSEVRVGDAMLAMVAGVVLGGRLGYVAFYDPALLWSVRGGFPWWGLLRLNEGGMSSHGGMLGVILASWFVARGPRDRTTGQRPDRLPWLHVIDLTAVACTPGLFFGRLANFVNGELLGRIVATPGEPAPWWTVKYPHEVYSGHAASPDQPAIVERALAPLRLPGESGDETFARVLDAIQHGRAPDAAARLEPLLAARHPSQLYQAAAEGLVLGAALWLLWRRPRRAGVVGSLFLIIYGVLRIATEYWRLPDADLAVQRVLGLSRGQWLSVLMVAVGLAALAIFRRRDRAAPGPTFAGWARA